MFSIFQSKRVNGGDRVGGITFGVSTVYGGTGRKEKRWYKNCELHRSCGPAFTCYYVNGTKWEDSWYENGKQHRLSGPATTYYSDGGMKMWERWFENGKRHRSSGPATTYYYENGMIKEEKWFKNGKMIPAVHGSGDK